MPWHNEGIVNHYMLAGCAQDDAPRLIAQQPAPQRERASHYQQHSTSSSKCDNIMFAPRSPQPLSRLGHNAAIRDPFFAAAMETLAVHKLSCAGPN